MSPKILNVFLSSTAKDLDVYREIVRRELLSTNLYLCVNHENFGPQNGRPVSVCRAKVKSADIFVGLIGLRRGWEPKGAASITEMEHEWARKFKKPRYVWVTPENFSMAANLRDTDAQYERQTRFRQQLMEAGKLVISQTGFESPERLGGEVIKRLLVARYTEEILRETIRPPVQKTRHGRSMSVGKS